MEKRVRRRGGKGWTRQADMRNGKKKVESPFGKYRNYTEAHLEGPWKPAERVKWRPNNQESSSIGARGLHDVCEMI